MSLFNTNQLIIINVINYVCNGKVWIMMKYGNLCEKDEFKYLSLILTIPGFLCFPYYSVDNG